MSARPVPRVPPPPGVAAGAPPGRRWVSAQPVVVGEPIAPFEPCPTGLPHRTTPYRPDTVADGWATDRLTLRAASVRGYGHRHAGAPRQDDLAVAAPAPGRLVVAVADGVSAAPQSHVGATVAARYAAQWLAEHAAADPCATDWEGLVRSTAWALVDQAAALLGEPPDADAAEAVMATTLVAAVVDVPPEGDGPATVCLVGVGDSGAWVLRGDRYQRLAGGKEDGGPITSSAVAGLPRVPDAIEAYAADIPSGGVLLLGTDGFGDPLGTGSGAVGHLFAGHLAAPPSMLEFAHLLDFSRETFDDDRTLVAVWPHPRPAAGSDGAAGGAHAGAVPR